MSPEVSTQQVEQTDSPPAPVKRFANPVTVQHIATAAGHMEDIRTFITRGVERHVMSPPEERAMHSGMEFVAVLRAKGHRKASERLQRAYREALDCITKDYKEVPSDAD